MSSDIQMTLCMVRSYSVRHRKLLGQLVDYEANATESMITVMT